MNSRALVLTWLTLLYVGIGEVLAQQSAGYLGTGQSTSAVDAKGVRHTVPSRVPAPWLNDRIKAVAPDYPYAERARHHAGEGRFRLYLDLKTGVVTKIEVTKSTGFTALDQCALTAFRQ